MPAVADETSEAHKRARRQINDIFSATESRMNGRHLRKVIAAYLEVRGLTALPFRVRSKTERYHGIQHHYLVASYPSPGVLWSVVTLPEGFRADLRSLVESWFRRNQCRLVLSERGEYWKEPVLARFDGCRVGVDPRLDSWT